MRRTKLHCRLSGFNQLDKIFHNSFIPSFIAALDVTAPADAVRRSVAEIRDDVDLVVLLTHQGKTAPMQTDAESDPRLQRDIDADIALAGAVDGVDVLFAGHADTGTPKPVVHPRTGTLIMQTYGQATHLGFLKLVLDGTTGEIKSYDGKLIPVDASHLTPDPLIAAKLEKYRAAYPEILEKAGRTEARMNRRYIEESDATASELKYTKGIKRVLAEEWVNPSEEFVKAMAGRVYSGRMTKNSLDQFGQITKQALQQFVNDRVNERLKSALEGEQSAETTADPSVEDVPPETERQTIVTTEEEIEGFYVVKSSVREVLDVGRVFMRDTQTYCGVLVDDNNRHPICRMWFNAPKKYLGTFDAQKNETRHPITDVNGIYDFADELRKTAMLYADRAGGEADSDTGDPS